MWRMWQADHHVGTNVGEAGQRNIWLQVLHMVNDHHKLDASNWSLFTLGGIVHAGIKLGGGYSKAIGDATIAGQSRPVDEEDMLKLAFAASYSRVPSSRRYCPTTTDPAPGPTIKDTRYWTALCLDA